MTNLLDMLTYKRPAGSRTERQFIRRFIKPTGATPDNAGNYVLRVGEGSRVAWLSHTDTVHNTGGRQELKVQGMVASVAHPEMEEEEEAATLTLDAWKRFRHLECLGADDTTGVWLMLEMIRAGVPGLYIFHRGEELGCVGSGHIARRTPELLDGIHFAISLDRRGVDSVVTHQCGRRTASDVFAWSLIDALELHDYGAAPDPSGVYTDSESYAGLVPECTNISVGYENQHSSRESQDLVFAEDLRDRLVGFDESLLLCDREVIDDEWEEDEVEDWQEVVWHYLDEEEELDPWWDVDRGLKAHWNAPYSWERHGEEDVDSEDRDDAYRLPKTFQTYSGRRSI